MEPVKGLIQKWIISTLAGQFDGAYKPLMRKKKLDQLHSSTLWP